MVHHVGGALGHAATPAAWAEATALAREGNEPLEGAGAAADAGKAVGQDAASEEVAELLFHEVGQTDALGAMGHLTEKGLEVIADDFV
jgi:hypothetical protein